MRTGLNTPHGPGTVRLVVLKMGAPLRRSAGDSRRLFRLHPVGEWCVARLERHVAVHVFEPAASGRGLTRCRSLLLLRLLLCRRLLRSLPAACQINRSDTCGQLHAFCRRRSS
jgi:hypothetical protein